MRKALTAGWRQFSYFSLFEDCLYVATFWKALSPWVHCAFGNVFSEWLCNGGAEQKKETKSLPTLPREEPEDAALHLEEMMIVRILSEVLVFIGPESNHWQCIPICDIITKSVSTVFWGRLLGRNWIWGSILSPSPLIIVELFTIILSDPHHENTMQGKYFLAHTLTTAMKTPSMRLKVLELAHFLRTKHKAQKWKKLEMANRFHCCLIKGASSLYV